MNAPSNTGLLHLWRRHSTCKLIHVVHVRQRLSHRAACPLAADKANDCQRVSKSICRHEVVLANSKLMIREKERPSRAGVQVGQAGVQDRTCVIPDGMHPQSPQSDHRTYCRGASHTLTLA